MKEPKITENLMTVAKAIGTRQVSIKELAQELKKTDNSVRSTVSVPSYKKYFTSNDENKDANGKRIRQYSLTNEGLTLIGANTNEGQA